jgi:acetylornithine/N-succinyldiaminopimelate aminotransferase
MTNLADSRLADLAAREHRVYMPTFKRQPVLLVRGQGCYVWDDAGTRYLDLVAGIAVNLLGHCHPAVVRAMTEQSATLVHTSNLYYTVPQIEFAELLTKLTGMDQVFFTNSGAEANEAAIKLARKYGKRYRNGAFGIVTARASFHGRTMATLAATGQEKYQAPFTPLPPGFTHVPFNDIDALRGTTTPDTIAVLLEPVQGEGGIYPADAEYLQAVRRHCDEHGLLLILDEIQSGLGRTGTFLAGEGYGVQGDIVTLAKGLCGGLPGGAVLARGQASCFEPGDHGSTMGGGPLVMAVGLATVHTLLAEGLMENARTVGAYLLDQLRALQTRHSQLTAVRGRGLMVAFDLRAGVAAALVDRSREAGLLVNNTSTTTVRMVPPLTLTTAQVDQAIAILDTVLASL